MASKILTRKALLKNILRYRFLDIITCSLCISLFLIPNILFNIFVGNTFLNQDYLLNVILVYAIKIILIMIFGVGISGAFYFFKKLVFSEGASVRKDYFEGIRKNLKQFLIIYFWIGLLYGILHVNIAILAHSNIDNNLSIIIIGIMYLIFGLFLIISIFMQTQSVIYVATTYQLFKNALKFTIGKILINIILLIALLFPLLLIEFIGGSTIYYISIIILIFGYIGFSVLVYTLYSYSIFDQTINKSYYPELIRRGLEDIE